MPEETRVHAAPLGELVEALEKQADEALRVAIELADALGIPLPPSTGMKGASYLPGTAGQVPGWRMRLVEATHTIRGTEILLRQIRDRL